MHQSFEIPASPHLEDTQDIHFYYQWNAVKALPCKEKNLDELPRPLRIKHNSINRLQVCFF